MTGFGGIWAINDYATAREDLDRFSKALGIHDVTHRPEHEFPVRGFICWTTARCETESEADLPCSSEELVVVCEGKLHNRHILTSSLHRTDDPGLSNAQLLAAMYRKWSAEALQYVTGDYAVCVWDSERQSVFLARDPFGTRPLFYHADGRRVAWCTAIGPLVALLDRESLDDEYIAGFLTLAEESARTPYSQIRAVEPGTVVSFGRSFSIHRFWPGGNGHELTFKRDADYEFHFRHLFTQAVRRRLEPGSSVLCELSGGLDSSSITCVAARLLQGGDLQDTSVHTLTYVYDRCATSDERRFAAQIEDHVNLPRHHVLESEHPLLTRLLDAPKADLPTPTLCFCDTFTEVNRIATHLGAGTLLSGVGGDDILVNEVVFFPVLADSFLSGQWQNFARLLRGWRQSTQVPYWSLLYRGLVWPLLPSAFRAVTSPEEFKLPKWIDAGFAARTQCQARLLLPFNSASVRSIAKRRQYALLSNVISNVSYCYYQAQVPLNVTYPFLDRDLVEFLLAIPIDQIQRPGQLRSIQRRALADILPPKIARRKSKGGPDEALLRAVNDQWAALQQLLQGSRICARGYADAAHLENALILARNGVAPELALLLRILALEIWLRAREIQRPAPLRSGLRQEQTWAAQLGTDHRFNVLYRSATPHLLTLGRRKENHEQPIT